MVNDFTGGHRRPPNHKKAGADWWLYLQMVKQRNEHGCFQGTKLRAIFDTPEEMTALVSTSTAYIEGRQLINRHLNSRQLRKTLAFPKSIAAFRVAATWEDTYHNVVKPHRSLRLSVQDALPQKWSPSTPALVARLTDHSWTVKELLTTLPLPKGSNT